MKSDNCDYSLEKTAAGLQLISQSHPNFKPLRIDFLQGKTAYRRQHGGGHKQMLAKACGIKKNSTVSIIDATAGLGQDAFVLASLGCKVLMLEQSEILGALLQDALDRLYADPSSHGIDLRLVVTDAIDYLTQLKSDSKPDIIYCDPMFPVRQKSALVKKEMQILHDLIGLDPTPEKLVLAAMAVAKQRVVVKRPRHSPTLLSQPPTFVIAGQTTRFDVYVVKGGLVLSDVKPNK